ncbi:hypothetical protein ACF0H5_001504 [Mactra antiquata]
MQYIKFFKPNGFAWEMLDHFDVDIDKSVIVTHPVRRYFHGNHLQYTILACADYRSPHKIFYDLEISRPHDVEFPTSPFKDIRLFRQIITEFPVPEQAYIKAENKLRKKIDEKRLQLFQQRRMELVERTRLEIVAKEKIEILVKKANEYEELVAKINAPCTTNTTLYHAVVDNMKEAENEVQNMTNMKNAADDEYGDDNDDDDYANGVLGVYARSD